MLGSVHISLGHVQTAKGYQQWIIVSDDPTSLQTFNEYDLRFDLEENFLDDKSAGFQLEASELRRADTLSRLLLILATTTWYLVMIGTVVVETGLRCIIDAHWFRFKQNMT